MRRQFNFLPYPPIEGFHDGPSDGKPHANSSYFAVKKIRKTVFSLSAGMPRPLSGIESSEKFSAHIDVDFAVFDGRVSVSATQMPSARILPVRFS